MECSANYYLDCISEKEMHISRDYNKNKVYGYIIDLSYKLISGIQITTYIS